MDSAGGIRKPGVFLRLLRMLVPYRYGIGLGLIILIASSPCELFPALVWKYVLDDLILTGRAPPTPWLSQIFSLAGHLAGWQSLLLSSLTWLFVVYVIGEALGTLSTNVMSRVAQRFIFELRNRVYKKLQSQSLGYLQQQKTGDLMSRAMGDVDELQSFVLNGIDTIIGDGLLWTMTVTLVILMDWKIASAALVPLIVVYILLRIFNSKTKPIYRAARDSAGDVFSRLQENLSGVVVIKIFGREREEARRFENSTQEYYNQQIKAINARSLYFPFSRTVSFFSSVLVLGLGGYSILTGGGFTAGKLLAFRAYWMRLTYPLQTLARVNDMVQRAIAAARRVFEILDAPDELADAPEAVLLDSVRGELDLQNVSFRYPMDLAPSVLRDCSIHIQPGEIVALCGPSGAGKSTILNLLIRFYDPTDGSVSLDGLDLRSIRRDSLRRHFALVQQETFLFNDTVLDNIRYGQPDATMENVINAARAANAHEFISQFPQGYDTFVGERGVRLSGGQKQRISIARAFLSNPQILILDEPTSSVEPDAEAAIIGALGKLMKGRTTILTSHRPSLIQQATRVYVLIDGKIVEEGSPATLRLSGGWFERFIRTAEDPLAVQFY